jgi:hypothetical protein
MEPSLPRLRAPIYLAKPQRWLDWVLGLGWDSDCQSLYISLSIPVNSLTRRDIGIGILSYLVEICRILSRKFFSENFGALMANEY